MEDDDDDDSDIYHVSQSSHDGEMEWELTYTDTGNTDLLNSDDKQNSNMSM